jgi:hypothetical protein
MEVGGEVGVGVGMHWLPRTCLYLIAVWAVTGIVLDIARASDPGFVETLHAASERLVFAGVLSLAVLLMELGYSRLRGKI